MVLAKQVINIPISGGLDTKTDPFLADPPALLELQNARVDKTGRISKRYGYTALAASDVYDFGLHSLFDHGGALCAYLDDGSFLRYSSTASKWTKTLGIDGTFARTTQACDVSIGNVSHDATAYFRPDATTAGGYRLYVWLSSDDDGVTYSLNYLFKDEAGQTVYGPAQLSVGGVSDWESIRCGHAGNSRFVVVAQAATSASLYYWTTTTPRTGLGSSTLLSTGSNVGMLDMVSDDTHSVVHVLHTTVAAATLRVHNINSSGSVSVSTNLAGTASSGDAATIYFHDTDGTIWIVYDDSGTLRYLVADPLSHAVASGPTAISTTSGAFNSATLAESPLDSNTCWVAWEESGVSNVRRRVRFATADDNGSVGTIRNLPATSIVAKAFKLNDKTYFALSNMQGTLLDPCGFLVTPDGAASSSAAVVSVVARFAQDEIKCGGLSGPGGTPMLSEGQWAELPFLVAYGTSAGGYDHGVRSVKFAMPTAPIVPMYVHGVSHFASGNFYSFDGSFAGEVTPHVAPIIEAVTLSASGSITAGDHSWIVVWEYEDREGNLHRGYPSEAVSATVTTSQTATIRFHANVLTNRDTTTARPLRAALYRTEVGGTTYKLVKRVVPTASGTVTGDVEVTDTASDTSIANNELLYTTGGVVPNDPPPPAVHAICAKGRVFLIDANNPNKVWYSKLLADRTAPEFSASFVITLPDGKAATALGEVDGTLVIFTASQIFAVAGDGPLDTGQQDTFAAPTLVSGDVGCLSKNSVVKGPFGLMFLGNRGIYTLSRSFEVSYSGAPVDDLIFPSNVLEDVVSAVLVPKFTEVRFQLATNDVVAVYNYLFGTWSKNTGNNGDHATLWNGTYTWGRTVTGSVGAYAENWTSPGYADPSTSQAAGEACATHAEFRVTSPWIKVAGLQGFQRVKRVSLLGAKVTACSFDIEIGYDYASTYATTIAYTQSEMSALTPWQPVVHIPRQKCESIRFRISDNVPDSGTPGGAYTLSGIAIEVGAKEGINKNLPATARK